MTTLFLSVDSLDKNALKIFKINVTERYKMLQKKEAQQEIFQIFQILNLIWYFLDYN